ncbi:MAG: 3-phosphoshikimate 1-carboxyvinyltransferase [Peptostreptococcaceae bacterium]
MLRGYIKLVGDKSISHRAIMFSSIAKGENKISNFLMGEDCLSTISCFKKLGVGIRIEGNEVYIKGNGLYGLKKPNDILDVGNSGTTIRLMMGILAGNEFKSTITGDNSIGKRPMDRVINPLRSMGAKIDEDNYTPINIHGGSLNGIDYKMPISSAQVKSSLILASLYANGESLITEKSRSRNHTEIMLKSFGANIEVKDLSIKIKKTNELYNHDIFVPGDISSASFLIVGALITEGSEIIIKNVGLNETRTGIIDVIRKMNGNIELINQKNICGELVGDLLVRYTKDLQSTIIDKELIPKLIDEIPIIAVLATQCEGKTIIKDAKELKVKESNRISSVVSNLKVMGADVVELEDGMIINGKTKLNGGNITTYHDHRIAMAFYIAGLISSQKVVLDNPLCVNISFPKFFETVESLIN